MLAALATMGVSSFHRHFRAVTSMTPIQFPEALTGRRHRGRLRGRFASPSQFSREYRRMFGVPPSDDALALRESAALPV
jgi:AraC-like DNA-binding protein